MTAREQRRLIAYLISSHSSSASKIKKKLKQELPFQYLAIQHQELLISCLIQHSKATTDASKVTAIVCFTLSICRSVNSFTAINGAIQTGLTLHHLLSLFPHTSVSLMVSVAGFHSIGPGSIPPADKTFFTLNSMKF